MSGRALGNLTVDATRAAGDSLTCRPAVPIPPRQIDWAITIACAVTSFVVVGICAIAVSLLLDPLLTEFHWKNRAASEIATAFSLGAVLSYPVAGWVIDRLGSKIVMSVGIILVAIGFFGLSFCSTLSGFYAAFALIGVGYGGAFYLSSAKLVATRTGEKKNLAMGIWMGACSVGAAVFSVAANWSILEYGWRRTSVAAALLILGMIPVILAVIPTDDKSDAGGTKLSASVDRTPPIAMFVSPEFLVLTAASVLAWFGMQSVYFHTVPILLKGGLSGRWASVVFGSSWILSGIGSLITGALANRVGTGKVLAGSLLFGALGTAALIGVQAAPLGMLPVLVFVLLWGTTANAVTQFLPILFVERFGSSHLGALVGVQSALMGVAGSLAPIVTGSLFDRYSSYVPAIIASVLTTSVACLLVWFLTGHARRQRAILTP